MTTSSPPPETLTLILPSRNEGRSLDRVVRQWWAQRPPGFALQILVVDDASTDNTADVLRGLAAEVPVRTLRNAEQLGYSRSLRVGIRNTTTKWIAMVDADGQYDPADLPKLLAAVSSDTVLANAWRQHRADPLLRLFISLGFRGLILGLFQIWTRDPTSALKAARTERFRAVSEKVQYMAGSFGNEFIVRWRRAGYTVVPVPVRHYPRLEGESRIVAPGSLLRVTLQQLIAMVRLWRDFHRVDPAARPSVHADADAQ